MNPSVKQEWRPYTMIRPKVIGLIERDNRLLVCEVLNDDGSLKGWCPAGGGIEFGETAEEALKREIQEELNSDIIITGDPIICENIFDHHGDTGHEIVFAFPIKLLNEELYQKQRFQIFEDSGSVHWVEWISMKSFENEEAGFLPSIIFDKYIANYIQTT